MTTRRTVLAREKSLRRGIEALEAKIKNLRTEILLKELMLEECIRQEMEEAEA